MNLDKDTPLIDAVENSHLPVVKLLLAARVNPRQVNARGEEPIDLVDQEDPDGKEIRAALERARATYDRRRPSEDNRAPHTGRDSVSGRSPRESPSLGSARRGSPPLSSRRRPGRSEPSRNDLLWMNPTRENLRDKAARGDDAAVSHILSMNPIADDEAVLVAAKGGHEACLQFLFAMGNSSPDPDPVRGYKDGYNTPMLVSIGKNKLSVVKLLLDQPGFDPTRRLYKKLTYHTLARERQGVDWEEECRYLKAAYDKHREKKGSKSSSSSSKSPQSRKVQRKEDSTSPRRIPSSNAAVASKDQLVRKRSITDGRNGHATQERTSQSQEKTLDSRKLLKVPRRESREGSNATSDREVSPMVSVNGDKDVSHSDAEKDTPKPRKRLISGKERKHDQERRRRNSLLSADSESSNQDRNRMMVNVPSD